nr:MULTISPECIES: ATP-binding protein [Myxococcaceae]
MAALAFAVLYVMVGRPLRRTEETVEALGRLELEQPFTPGGGPLLSRVQGALGRMAVALQEERRVTQAQLVALREAHARVSRAQTELVAAERLATVGKLAAGVAHEVGNPLSGVLGYLSLARGRAAPLPDVVDYLDRIELEVQRIDGIVRRLLELGRPAPLQLSPVDVGALVQSCVELLRAGPDFARVHIRLELTPAVARTASDLVSQILINLLLNAAQAQEGAGEVAVHVGTSGGRVQLRVEDAGQGIPPEVLPHLFEPFFTTRTGGRGSGLGLAVSLHLATTLGGRLTAENRPERGARFTLELPAA